MLDHLNVVTHPLVQHKLTLMRDKSTSTAGFRRLLREISLLLAYEITRELPVATTRIETPLQAMDAPVLEGKKIVVVSIMRAGQLTSDGDRAFHRSIVAQNPAAGYKDDFDVMDRMQAAGLEMTEVIEMPANNLSVVLRRG